MNNEDKIKWVEEWDPFMCRGLTLKEIVSTYDFIHGLVGN